MKIGWKVKNLSEIGRIYNGNSVNEKVKKNEYTDVKSGLPYIGTKDISYKNEINYDNSVRIPFKEKTIFRIAPKNTPLICAEGGSAGRKIGFTDQEICFGNKLFAIVVNEDMESKYVYYYYFSENFQKYFTTELSGLIGGVSLNKFKNIEIPFPHISEQKRIVSVLDKVFDSIDKARENAEKNLRNSKEIFESYINKVFSYECDGWINTTIGEVCNLQTGGTPSTGKKEYYINGTIKWLVSGDINLKTIYDCEGRITDSGMNNSNAKYLPVNSVLIALNGQGKTRGMVAMLKTKATCNQSLVSIYPNNLSQILPELIFINLKGRYDEIRKLTGDGGNDRRGLNMPLIRSIKFSYPENMNMQEEIVSNFNHFNAEIIKLESIYKNKLENLDELKKSILKKAFAGEL